MHNKDVSVTVKSKNEGGSNMLELKHKRVYADGLLSEQENNG